MNSLEYLLSFQRFGIKLGLDNINYLLDQIGNPHSRFRVIHITGTNGKGSVAAFLSSVLEEKGFRVGRFISPHLIDFSERIVVNDNPISRQDIDELVEQIRPVVHAMQAEPKLGHPTFFEAVTAMAFSYFARMRIDFGVIEVGMGGRYDSTNVVNPCLCVITNIHLEHCEYLGDTIEKIAVEKAGIIKPGVDVVSAADRPEARQVIDQKAGECGSAVFYLGRDFRVSSRRDRFPRQYIDFEGPWGSVRDIELNLGGDFQASNAALAVMGIETLAKRGIIPSDESALRAGMAAARWPARLEKILDSPMVLLDGAHNPSAMRALADTIQSLFPGRRIILVVAILSDKDSAECLRILRSVGSTIILTQSTYERALSAEKLLAVADGIFENPLCEPSLAAAMRRALSLCGHEEIILVAGSLFNVAEVKQFVENMNTKAVWHA
ncbi:MAG: bifunctional folylpolyglutamate synthase/dihydrofolate synthase [Candidatus Abyssobacteria bacterium SURF_5]|uniref:Dihydrofolate synthase/folylpolyglutamate synthase n=1 Tax=Abyssobacteria bacterium (strain SURF_5) TaxID=2093360 RepID=A0A3A4NZL6_ABYX5|nr:MAG: bifunctional folylpolyglutamate synthase/dihydrofolate synthase [Candidatus Abyssubacteria bacterium SURF_5]